MPSPNQRGFLLLGFIAWCSCCLQAIYAEDCLEKDRKTGKCLDLETQDIKLLRELLYKLQARLTNHRTDKMPNEIPDVMRPVELELDRLGKSTEKKSLGPGTFLGSRGRRDTRDAWLLKWVMDSLQNEASKYSDDVNFKRTGPNPSDFYALRGKRPGPQGPPGPADMFYAPRGRRAGASSLWSEYNNDDKKRGLPNPNGFYAQRGKRTA